MIQSRFITWVVSKACAASVPYINALVAFIVTKIAVQFPDLAALINQPALVVFIWGCLGHLENYITTHLSVDQAKAVQAGVVRTAIQYNLNGNDTVAHTLEVETGLPVKKAIENL